MRIQAKKKIKKRLKCAINKGKMAVDIKIGKLKKYTQLVNKLCKRNDEIQKKNNELQQKLMTNNKKQYKNLKIRRKW